MSSLNRVPVSKHEQEPQVILGPKDAVGGVWVASEQRQVPVSHSDHFDDNQGRFSIDEFTDEEGNVRASLMTINPGEKTPAWQIKREPKTFGYIEIHQIVSGSGQLIIRPRQDDSTRPGFFTNDSEERIFDVREATQEVKAGQVNQPIQIMPGETFQVVADKDVPLQILATMPVKPFKLEYEERVGSLV